MDIIPVYLQMQEKGKPKICFEKMTKFLQERVT
jgi:hypothetical protein